MSVDEAAEGLLKIVNHGMIQAVRKESIRRGLDVRKYSLLACGGAGPLHACEVAEELGMKSVIIPPNPGILSALGLMATDMNYDYSKTELQLASKADLEKMKTDYAELEDVAYDRLIEDKVPENRRVLYRVADCRYEGQGYELRVDVPSDDFTEETVKTIQDRFHKAHASEFGMAFYDNDVEIVNIRVLGIGKIPELKWPTLEKGSEDPSVAFKYTREVHFNKNGSSNKVSVNVYEHKLLKSGNVIEGPAIVEQMDSTIVITPGSRASVDDYGIIVISLS
jgi:N-methylhydantoinase A